MRKITKELTKMGHDVSHTVVSGLLHDMNYSLLANSKTLEGTNHIDRDARFEYINKQAKAFLTRNQPIISVDTKKGPFEQFVGHNDRIHLAFGKSKWIFEQRNGLV